MKESVALKTPIDNKCISSKEEDIIHGNNISDVLFLHPSQSKGFSSTETSVARP